MFEVFKVFKVPRNVAPLIGMIMLWLGVLSPAALGQSASTYRQEGLAAREAGDWSRAMIAFEQAVRLDPKNLSGRVLWGWTLHLAGEDAQAAVVLRKNFALDPYHGETLNALGIVYLFQDQVWPAVLTHSWAALLQPDNEIPFYNLSLGFQRLGLHDWAIATGEYASVLEPNNPHPLLATALAYGSRRSLTDPHTHHQVTQLFQATLALDGRYGDPAFWLHLREADFSLPQIAAVTTLWQQVISPP